MYPVLNTDTWFFPPYTFFCHFPKLPVSYKLFELFFFFRLLWGLKVHFFPMEINCLLGHKFKAQATLKDSCYAELVQQNPTIIALNSR